MDSGHGATWWRDGWRLFAAAPWVWIGILLIYLLIMFGLGFIPFIGQVASSLLWPPLFAGVLIGARELDRGGTLKIEHLFACLNARAVPLIIVALLYYLGWLLLWIAAAGVLVMMFGLDTLGSMMSSDPSEAGMALLDTFGIGSLLVLLVAATLSVPLVMAYWFAPALIVFRGADPVASMKSSFVACLRNMPPFLIYSLLGLVFAIVATVPFGLGWLAFGPVFICSLYASYKDIFGAPP